MRTRCKLCGKNVSEIPVFGGRICRACFDRLPFSVQASAGHFTPDQLRGILRIARPLCEKPWLRVGRFHLCDRSIQLNQTEYELSALCGIRLRFHPRTPGDQPGTVRGALTLVLETKSPHLFLEEPFLDSEVCLPYKIRQKRIVYRYPRNILRVIGDVRRVLAENAENLQGLKRQYQNEKRKEQQEKESNSQQRKESKKESNSKVSARELFGLQEGFTMEELKEARNRLLKRYHPDQGGSVRRCQEILRAYESLKERAV